MKVLLSIKPKYVKEITNGSKLYEFRKTIFSPQVKYIYVYESAPTKKIVGKIVIDIVIEDTPKKLWANFKRNSGISKQEFFEYFKDKEKGYAIKIKKYVRYKKPINPYRKKERFVPPQSYLYLTSLSDFLKKRDE